MGRWNNIGVGHAQGFVKGNTLVNFVDSTKGERSFGSDI